MFGEEYDKDHHSISTWMANTSAWGLVRDHFRRRKFILCLQFSFDDHQHSYQGKFDFNDVNCLPWQKATVSKINDKNYLFMEVQL